MSDYASIINLIGQYAQLLDDREYEKWSMLFTENATLELVLARVGIANQACEGRLAIRSVMSTMGERRKKDNPDSRGLHVAVNPIIAIEGTSATGSTDFMFYIQDRLDEPPALLRGGRFTDQFVKVQGRWWFARRRIEVMLAPPNASRS